MLSSDKVGAGAGGVAKKAALTRRWPLVSRRMTTGVRVGRSRASPLTGSISTAIARNPTPPIAHFDARIEPPATWEELMEQCRQLKKDGVAEYPYISAWARARPNSGSGARRGCAARRARTPAGARATGPPPGGPSTGSIQM